jgi:hypothetical protein
MVGSIAIDVVACAACLAVVGSAAFGQPAGSEVARFPEWDQRTEFELCEPAALVRRRASSSNVVARASKIPTMEAYDRRERYSRKTGLALRRLQKSRLRRSPQ